MLALAVTGGLFAYTYTTQSTSITAISKSADFATVSANNTMSAYNLFGSYRGSIGSGTLFNVTPATDYSGDIEVNVYLTNADELSKNYGLFLMRLQFQDISNNPADVEGINKPLTLRNGVVTFTCDNLTGGDVYHVQCLGGVYQAFPWSFLSGGSIYDPSILYDVGPAGL